MKLLGGSDDEEIRLYSEDVSDDIVDIDDIDESIESEGSGESEMITVRGNG